MNILYKLKRIITLFFFILLLFNDGNAQVNCAGGRYQDSLFLVDTIHNVFYGKNVNYDNSQLQLTMDIYLPHGDVASKRPLIIVAPGGSFIIETKADYTTTTLCKKFASIGYVAAGIDYRVGVNYANAINGEAEQEFIYAVIRAEQDYRAAIRYFRKDAATSNIYKIDTNIIIAGGSSAGAITALHVAYLKTLSELPILIDSVGIGGIEGLSGNPGYTSNPNYVVNLCGAIGDTNWIKAGDVPVISMQGNNNKTVPYGTSTIYVGGFAVMVVEGSSSIKKRCDHVGVENPFYSFQGAGHVPYDYTAGGSYLKYMDTTISFVKNNLYNWICEENTGIAENKTNFFSVLVSPNPFSDYTIISTTSEFQNVTFSLFDITGKEIKRNENISGNHFRINKNEMTSGIYFYKIIGNNSQFANGKIVIL